MIAKPYSSKLRPTSDRDVVAALHLAGQREESLRLLLGSADQILSNAVIGNDREAIFLEAAPDLRSERGSGASPRRAARRKPSPSPRLGGSDPQQCRDRQ